MKYVAGYIAVALVIAVPIAMLANPSIHPLGTTIYRPDRFWNGFTILSADKGYLIDMNGNLPISGKGNFITRTKSIPEGTCFLPHPPGNTAGRMP